MSNEKNRFSKRKRSGTERAVIICLILLIIMLLLLIGWTARDSFGYDADAVPSEPTSQSGLDTPPETNASEQVPPPQIDETKADVYMQLPMVLEDGKLELESLFQYTGLNPDAYWEDAVNVGAVVLSNQSVLYLDKLDLAVILSDGTVLNFFIQDLPSGKTVMAYELENASYSVDVLIQSIECQAVFRENGGPTLEDVAIEVNGMDVMLTNHSKSDLTNVRIVCHNAVEDLYFGGIAYAYPVEKLSAQETVTVTAYDCLLGELDVSLVDYEK